MAEQIDTANPSSARVWNYLLGGKDNYEIDRIVGDQVRASFPAIVG
jgi:S-adenosyl methyltransferase